MAASSAGPTTPRPKTLWRRRLPRRVVVLLLSSMAGLLLLSMGGVMVVLRTLSRDLPSAEQLQSVRPPSKTLIFSAEGDTLHEFFLQNRVLIPLEEIPHGLIQAIVATEDRRFYEHYGIDLGGMLRAAWVNLRSRRAAQGGSTLTQQLARSLFLTPAKRWERKVREILLALQLERTYTKDEILEMYLNTVYFGHGGAYGVEAAAQAFFGKSVRDLEPAEYTLLAGVLPNPGFYSPVHHLDRAYQRRAVVLASMVREGFLSQDEAQRIGETEVVVRSREEQKVRAPYFVEEIRQYLESHYGAKQLYEEGLRVYTTLSTPIQEYAEAAFEAHLRRKEEEAHYAQTRAAYDSLLAVTDSEDPPDPEYLQGALVVMDTRTGDVLAMIGGRDYATSKFNRAEQAQRQPGSIFKPFLYTAALQRGWTTASVLLDSPVEVDTGADELWRPVNFDLTFRGPIPFRQALAHSINVPSVRLILQTGTHPVIELAHRMGVESPLPEVYSIALGSGEANLMELVTAYTAFANHGIRTRPRLFTRITDARGEVLEETRPYQEDVLDEKVAYVMTDILRTALREGTGRSSRAMGWVWDGAGKTGTTDRNTDAWYIGYTPELVCGVWVGFDKKVSMGRRKTGAVMALPIWAGTMVPIYLERDEVRFERPEGIVDRFICSTSGQLATAACTDVHQEIFLEGSEPSRLCPIHRPGGGEGDVPGTDFESIDENASHSDEFGRFGGGY